MSIDAAIPLTTNIAEVRGVGPKRAEAFRRMGIRCVADLILHLPARYELELGRQSIAAAGEEVSPLHGSAAKISVRGEIATCRLVKARRQRFEATLEDGTGTMLLTWFNAPWLAGKIHPGLHITAVGRAKRQGDYLQLVNPTWKESEPDPSGAGQQDEPPSSRLRPIYPAGEDLTSRQIEAAVSAILDPALATIEDHLHEAYRKERALPLLADAYRMVHRPGDDDEAGAGRRRLAFDELLLLQLGVMLKRRHRRETLTAHPFTRSDAIHEHILARFPFELTPSQRLVVDEIALDLGRDSPMNRLLQGDVGSGKTAVALYAMLLAVASKHQAALLAPTELLAEQHYQSITNMLTGSTVGIELLTGSRTPSERADILQRTESGEIDMLIGTHALLTESVRFKSLAIAVIDEQHRFGVHQRAVIRDKSSDTMPHILVMTATPIPRTLSLTVFGDLDVSVIHGQPPGRTPIETRVVNSAVAAEVYDYVARRLRSGDQAYIVVPVIDESDSGLKNVTTHLEQLQDGPLRHARLKAMHGRVGRDDRDAIMRAFRQGSIDALVATTVIEVGVDVPNATIMVIEHAERFGLAQLHQLRGRVGRGSKRSLCVFIADPTTDEGTARIEAIASAKDGFDIAEKDLEIRGPGDVFGTRQSGIAPFRVADLVRDLKLLEMARRDAVAWIDENPILAGDRDALLKKRLLKAHGEALGLGDVA